MTTSSISLIGSIRKYYPSLDLSTPASQSDSDVSHLSQSIYPSEHYNDNEKVEIGQWISTSHQLSSGNEDEAKRSERLSSLNTHLYTRTTILGSKPSIADAALFDSLAPLVSRWSPEERTGEQGYHHIVRYVDFLQNSPAIGLAVKDEDKVAIDPSQVLFVHKPLDPKEEKERKKKEKAVAEAAAKGEANTTTLPLGQSKGETQGKSKKEKVKETATNAKENVKAAVTGDPVQTTQKKEKKEKAPKQQKAPPAAAPLSPSLIDLRVGHILKAVAHPNADSLYVSTIAVGDPPGTENTSEYDGQVVRTVCSGLNGLIPLEEMQNRKIVAVCNLKPVTMRGVKSCAMVLAASPRLAEGELDNHAGPVELVNPPADAKAGERIWFEGWEGEPEGVLNPKKKVWEMCQAGFTTTDNLGVAFEMSKVEQLAGEASAGKPALAKLVAKSGGECKVKTLKGATVR